MLTRKIQITYRYLELSIHELQRKNVLIPAD